MPASARHATNGAIREAIPLKVRGARLFCKKGADGRGDRAAWSAGAVSFSRWRSRTFVQQEVRTSGRSAGPFRSVHQDAERLEHGQDTEDEYGRGGDVPDNAGRYLFSDPGANSGA